MFKVFKIDLSGVCQVSIIGDSIIGHIWYLRACSLPDLKKLTVRPDFLKSNGKRAMSIGSPDSAVSSSAKLTSLDMRELGHVCLVYVRMQAEEEADSDLLPKVVWSQEHFFPPVHT